MKKCLIMLIIMCAFLCVHVEVAFAYEDYTDPQKAWDFLVAEGIIDEMTWNSATLQDKIKDIIFNGTGKGTGGNTGSQIGGTYYGGGGGSGTGQCWGYGNDVMKKLFGVSEYNSNGAHVRGDGILLTELLRGDTEYNYENFKKAGIPQRAAVLIRTAPPSHYSLNAGDDKGHTEILLYYNEKYAYVIDGNNRGSKPYKQCLWRYTWEEWSEKQLSGKSPSRKIKYVIYIEDEVFLEKYPDAVGNNTNEGNGKYQSAPDRIAYYHQYMKTDGKTTWDYHTNNTYWDEKLNSVYGLAISDGDGDSPNISGRGCGLLAYGHAIQWLDGKADSTRQIEILAELVRKSKNPPTAEEIYGKYVASEYNATFGEKVTKWTEEYLRNVFDQDGVVIVCNRYSSEDNSGHIALAIGYRVYNGTFYVQMMDSTCRATLKRLPDGGASAKVYDFSAAANLTYSAGQYWVPLKQFSGIIKWSYSLIPNDSSGDNSDTKPIPSPTFAPLFNIRAGFKTTEKMITRAEPFDSAASVKTLEKGKMFVVFKFVTNSEGDIWAQLDEATDNYVCFYDASKDKVMLDFVNVAQNTTVSGFPTSSSDDGYPGYPTGDREPGGCPLRGTITSVAPMLSIEARVTNLSTNKEVLSVTAKPKYDLRSAKINSDITNRDGSKTNINNKMSFSKVADDGHYVYEIAVQHGFVYEGKTFTFGDETVAFTSNFNVGISGIPEPDAPDEEPSLPDVPVSKKVPGDVNDDGRVNMKDSIQLLKSLCGWNVTINSVNAEVTGDGKVNMKDHILLLKYLCGWNVTLN